VSERVQVIHGDSREVLKTLSENSVDACVTDPPYALTSITKRWANTARDDGTMPRVPVYARATAGFMGCAWDNGSTAFDPDFWREVLRVLKPGAHLLAFSGTRTYHRMTCAIEDAGFEIRDMVLWHYGSGFPKSHDVSKGIDKAAGVLSARGVGFNAAGVGKSNGGSKLRSDHAEYKKYSPATDESRDWEGWGTALKPASEPIALARKPLSEKTVVANVLRWGTGALNIDGCRVEFESNPNPATNPLYRKQNGYALHTGDDSNSTSWKVKTDRREQPAHNSGRWPANLCHDGSEEVIAAFPDSDGQQGDVRGTEPSGPFSGHVYGDMTGRHAGAARNDTGSAARFFFSAKADADDRMGSKHPTVKPVDLMRWLVRLVTPPNGLILDPFAGSGTTGIAAIAEQKRAFLIEREAEYVEDIHRRLAHVAGKGPLSDSVKLRNKQTADAGPLFGVAP
jgi:DNA modification methylase